jgi:hypothetical protein
MFRQIKEFTGRCRAIEREVEMRVTALSWLLSDSNISAATFQQRSRNHAGRAEKS